MAKTRANALTKSIVGFLNFNGFVVWNVYNGGVYDPKLKRYRKNPTHKHGVFDICGFRKSDGRHLEIEIKVGADKLSPAQIEHLNDLSDAGALVFVARDFDSFESWFNNPSNERPKEKKNQKVTTKIRIADHVNFAGFGFLRKFGNIRI